MIRPLMRWLFIAMTAFAPLVATTINADHLVVAAKSQIGVTLSYSDAYVSIKYPKGDFSPLTGCCTDVLIRAYRKFDIDLQQMVHEDITKNMDYYSKYLTKGKPDRNIDHRRVATLQAFLVRQATNMPISDNPDQFKKGDIIVWRLPNGRLHIGLVSDVKNQNRPLVIHNIGYGVRSDDVLFYWKIIGHFRYLI